MSNIVKECQYIFGKSYNMYKMNEEEEDNLYGSRLRTKNLATTVYVIRAIFSPRQELQHNYYHSWGFAFYQV